MLVARYRGPAKYAPPADIATTMANIGAMVERETGVAISLSWETDDSIPFIHGENLSDEEIEDGSEKRQQYHKAAEMIASGMARWAAVKAKEHGEQIDGFLIQWNSSSVN